MLQHSEGAFRIFPHRLESLTEALHPPLESTVTVHRGYPFGTTGCQLRKFPLNFAQKNLVSDNM